MAISAPTPKLYPRGTLKRIVKAHARKNLSKNVDVLIYLDYALFVQELVREAAIRAKQQGERRMGAHHIRKVTEGSLRKFKG